jgi:sugar (pentulose or hexulose) kinase
VRYSLSHLVKDESTLSAKAWQTTRWIQSHGSIAAGYLTGRFDGISVSSAASTGLLDLRTGTWQLKMLGALSQPEHQSLVASQLPRILPMMEAIGPLSESIAADAGLPAGVRPNLYPTLDDQAAGLAGGGAVAPGQLAIILGNSAVVNSSFAELPQGTNLDVMRLNWGPYLAMRCYSNGAQFLDRIVGPKPDWAQLEDAGREVPPGCHGVTVDPFVLSEPSLGVSQPRFGWAPQEPQQPGVRLRAAYEAIAYLIALAVEEHAATGQTIQQISVSGGMARSELMLSILASVLNRPLERLVSQEGSALGAAVTAYAGVLGGDLLVAVQQATRELVRFKQPMAPRQEWVNFYQKGLEAFRVRLSS